MCRGNNRVISQRGNFPGNGKTLCKKASHKVLKSCLSFGRDLDAPNEEKIARQLNG